jgi:RNA polymerase sigma-70 factor (ECF subfamily)
MTETSSDISIEALRSGDRIQFARLVDIYSTPIYRLALRMLANEQDAEDVLQTTFIKALQHVAEFEGRSSLATWLYRIAANEALMLLRRKRPSISLDEESEDDDGEIQAPLQLADWAPLPETDLLNAEVKALLDRAIQSLPAKLRARLYLREQLAGYFGERLRQEK